MSKTLSSLSSLKDKLLLLESEVVKTEIKEKMKLTHTSKISEKLEKIRSIQQETIYNVSIRGKSFYISSKLINGKIDNVLADLIIKGKVDTSKENLIFLDMDFENFKKIHHILIFINENKEEERFKLYLENDEVVDFFNMEFRDFFKNQDISKYIEIINNGII